MTWRTIWKGFALVVVIVLLAAACGGDDDSADTSGNGDEQPENLPVDDDSAEDTDAGEEAAPAESSDDGGDDGEAPEPEPAAEEPAPEPQTSGVGSERAVVTIGAETFDFDMSIGCIALGGAIGAVGFTDDGLVQAEIDIPPEDWETSGEGWEAPRIRIRDERLDDSQPDVHHPDWQASVAASRDTPELAGVSQVDSFTVDGSAASGTATFTDTWARALGKDAPPVPGTFEINCG